ncbi:MAG: Gfo/Idh/MocA family protein [Chitinivibrionales bacterium]
MKTRIDKSTSLGPVKTTDVGSAASDLKIGVIGYGYWGPNIVRNFHGAAGATVACVCDNRAQALDSLHKNYPDMNTTQEYRDIIQATDIDVVAVVTPVSTHYGLAKKALLEGKHVFVEKPFTATVAEAEELINIAEQKNLKIMVDHTFLFTGAVRKIKTLISEGVLGDVYYYDSTRVNLGLFQHDANVIWDLAPHDFSIMRYVIDEKPVAISAHGKAHVGEYENIAYIAVHFANNLIAHFNVNWLSPVKLRNTLIGGEKKMLVWNDVDPDEKIKIYDKGIDVKNREGVYKMLVSYRTGDMTAPKIEPTEALRLETEHFVDCIVNDKTPISDATLGLEVVQMLEACDKSIKDEGRLVRL